MKRLKTSDEESDALFEHFKPCDSKFFYRREQYNKNFSKKREMRGKIFFSEVMAKYYPRYGILGKVPHVKGGDEILPFGYQMVLYYIIGNMVKLNCGALDSAIVHRPLKSCVEN